MTIPVGSGDISYVTMLPANALDKSEIWTSSDTSVATVDWEGYVIGRSIGSCIVTVKSKANPAVSAQIKVNVIDPDKITAISLSKTELVIPVNGGDISYVTMYPTTSRYKQEIWSCTDESVAVVDNEGYVFALKPGVCYVTVTSLNNQSVKATIKVIVTDANGNYPANASSGSYQLVNGVTYIDNMLIVNKSYALPASYDPGVLSSEVISQFSKLATAAQNEGMSFTLGSGYRSYAEQESIYNSYVSYYGKETADQLAARPGYSEHQSGLALDVTTPNGFYAGSKETLWLAAHAHEYGFIIRYPADKESITGYKYEPWHIRYVGMEKAAAIYSSGLCLEEYLGIDSYYHF